MNAALPRRGRGWEASRARLDAGGPGVCHRDAEGEARRGVESRGPAAGEAGRGVESLGSTANGRARRGVSRRPVLPAHVTSAQQLLCDLAGMGQGIVLPLAHAAGALAPYKSWFAYGYRNVHDFARESLRRSARWLRDLERLHAALDEFPQLGRSMSGADGGKPISQKAALCIAGVATREDMGLWIERARHLSLPDLRRAVAQTEPHTEGAQPGPPTSPGEPPHAHGANHTHGADAPVFIRLTGPPEVKLAFDAVKALHAAVVGQESGMEALIEAILGEAASAGWTALDELQSRLRHRLENATKKRVPNRHEKEERHRSAATAPTISVGSMSASPAMRRAHRTLLECRLLQRHLARLEASLRPTAGQASTSRFRDILRLIGILKRLIRLQDRIEIVMGDLLLEMHERQAWKLLGYTGLEAYAEECLGMGRSTARRRVSLARRLRRHAATRRAYESGLLGEEAALWVVRSLERGDARQGQLTMGAGGGAVGQHAPGAGGDAVGQHTPGAGGDAAGQLTPVAGGDAAGQHVPGAGAAEEHAIAHAASLTVKRLRDEAELLHRRNLLRRIDVAQAMTRSARRVPRDGGERRASGVGLPGDAEWHASLERGPGRTRDWILGLEHGLLERVLRHGPLLQVPILLSLPAATAAELLACVETVRQELCGVPAETSAEASRLRPSARMAQQLLERGEPVPSWLGLLGLLEECLCVWDEPRGMPRRSFDRVIRRDGYRCTAPGCTARAKLETHHLVYRSHGGSDALENLIVLCRFHHQQGEHGRLAQARGQAPLGVTWRLGEAEVATWWRNERRLEPAT